MNEINNGYYGNNNFNNNDKNQIIKEKNAYKKGMRTGFLWAMAAAMVVIMVVMFADRILLNKRYRKFISDIQENQVDAILGEGAGEKIDILNQYIEQFYYKDVDQEQLLEGTLDGLVASLEDPYSVYYNGEEYKEILASNDGTYCGIGVTVMQDPETKWITLTKINKNSPAEKSGLLVGDILVKVEGEDIVGQELTVATAKVRGEKGTSIEVTVLRDEKEITVSMVREEIEIETVAHKMLDNHVGYIYLAEFDGVSVGQVKNAIDDLMSQGMESLIFDIRDNPGGRKDVVLDILDFFLPENQLLMYEETKSGERKESYSKTEGILLDMPMTVLINGNSASASELFAGAMQSYERAKIIGTVSFGKGIVQSIFPLEDGTAIKLTVSRYFLPNHQCIHEEGITPDEIVEWPENMTYWTKTEMEDDVQIQAAIKALGQ